MKHFASEAICVNLVEAIRQGDEIAVTLLVERRELAGVDMRRLVHRPVMSCYSVILTGICIQCQRPTLVKTTAHRFGLAISTWT